MSGCVCMYVEFAPSGHLNMRPSAAWCQRAYLQIPSIYCVPANPNVLDIARSNQIVIYGSYYPEGKWAAISRASTHARAAAAAARIWARWRRRAESATWQTKLIRCHAANFASRANYADLVDTGIPAVCNTDECRDGPGFPQIGLEKWSP